MSFFRPLIKDPFLIGNIFSTFFAPLYLLSVDILHDVFIFCTESYKGCPCPVAVFFLFNYLPYLVNKDEYITRSPLHTICTATGV